MNPLGKIWHVYVGDSWVGTLTPTGADDQWYYAQFSEGDAWGNFAPWFERAVECINCGDDSGWHTWYSQLTAMGIVITSEDGESYRNPTLHIHGNDAWFVL
jgi:hypothetical protein